MRLNNIDTFNKRNIQMLFNVDVIKRNIYHIPLWHDF